MNGTRGLTYGFDDFQIVNVISRRILLRSLFVRRRVFQHVSRVTVVDGRSVKVANLFLSAAGGHVERKEAKFNDPLARYS